MSEEKSVTGVIFDCDGTLLNSASAWLDTQEQFAQQAQVELSEEDISTIITLTIPETGDFFHDRFGLGDSGEEVADMINTLMLKNYQDNIRPRDGALAFVRCLSSLGIKCSVASSTPLGLLEIALDVAGFTSFLTTIVSVEDVNASKREPAVYDLARSRMGTEKESTWVFEDAAYALRTLKAAGYHSVGIYDDDTAGTHEQLAIADIVIDSFLELDPVAFITNPLASISEGDWTADVYQDPEPDSFESFDKSNYKVGIEKPEM